MRTVKYLNTLVFSLLISASSMSLASEKNAIQRLGSSCYKLLLQRPAARIQSIRSKFEFGVPHKQLVLDGNVERYLEMTWLDHDNGQVIDAPLRPLKGKGQDTDALTQRLSSMNDDDSFPSYFKMFEKDHYNTWVATNQIFKNSGSKNSEEWKSAIAEVEAFVARYKSYRVQLNRLAVIGFMKQIQAEEYNKALKEFNPEFFEDPEIDTHGVPVEITVLEYDEKINEAISSKRTLTFYQWDDLVGMRNQAEAKYRKIFGMPMHPGLLAVNGIKRNPPEFGIGYLLSLPLQLFSGGWNMITGTKKWISSKLFTSGDLQRKMADQGLHRLRLQYIYKKIERKGHQLGSMDKLSPEVQILFDDIAELLVESELAPKSISVRKAQSALLKAESSVRWLRNSGRIKTLPAESLDFTHGEEEMDLTPPEPISVGKAIWDAMKKHKVASVILGVSLATTTAQAYDVLTYELMDNPYVASSVAWYDTGARMFMADMFGIDGNLKKEARSALRKWSRDEVSPTTVIDLYTKYYLHEFRKDSEYDFLRDPEYQRRVDLILRAFLEEQISYGGASMQADIKDFRILELEPEYTVKLMTEEFVKKYPSSQFRIQEVMSAFKENSYQPLTDEKFNSLAGNLPLRVRADLLHFMNSSYDDALAMFSARVSLNTRYETAYEGFGKAEIYSATVNTAVFSGTDANEILWMTSELTRFIKVGDAQGSMQRVIPINSTDIDSPTGDFYIQIQE